MRGVCFPPQSSFLNFTVCVRDLTLGEYVQEVLLIFLLRPRAELLKETFASV